MNDNWVLTEVNKCLYVLPNCDLVLFLTPISNVRILFCNDITKHYYEHYFQTIF